MNNSIPALWVGASSLAFIVLVWCAVRAIRWAQQGSKGASLLAAAAFPFPDQPPPHEQLERANRLDRDTDSGQPNG